VLSSPDRTWTPARTRASVVATTTSGRQISRRRARSARPDPQPAWHASCSSTASFVLADRLEICGTCASDLENENVDAIDAAIRTAPESWPDEPGMGSLMIRSLRRIDR